MVGFLAEGCLMGCSHPSISVDSNGKDAGLLEDRLLGVDAGRCRQIDETNPAKQATLCWGAHFQQAVQAEDG